MDAKLARIVHVLHAPTVMTQEVNTVKVEFEEHADATEFFDALVEACEPDADAVIDDLEEAAQ